MGEPSPENNRNGFSPNKNITCLLLDAVRLKNFMVLSDMLFQTFFTEGMRST